MHVAGSCHGLAGLFSHVVLAGDVVGVRGPLKLCGGVAVAGFMKRHRPV